MYSLVKDTAQAEGGRLNMFSKKTVCFVTGASRGYGESVATNFASRLPAGSVVVLLARSEGDLERVKNRLLQKAPEVKTVAQRFDQGTQDQTVFETVFTQSLSSVGAKVEDFQQAILVNNAASMGPLLYIRNFPAVQELTDCLSANVSGAIALTSQFLRTFPAECEVSRFVVNITSLAATQPFKSWAMYCAAKAAKDMFFKVLAVEEPSVRVLNWAPGPLITDMTEALQKSEDEDVANWAKNAKDDKILLPCDTSVEKFMEILDKNAYQNGQHVDYYDE